tara:strand:- start:1460 stop:1591 length:132 start_codon:yes stop_codon:yes gene_type:complete
MKSGRRKSNQVSLNSNEFSQKSIKIDQAAVSINIVEPAPVVNA